MFTVRYRIVNGTLPHWSGCETATILSCKKKHVFRSASSTGGSERIRTAVGAFAELSLATRPRNQFRYWYSKLSSTYECPIPSPINYSDFDSSAGLALAALIFSFSALNASISPRVDFSVSWLILSMLFPFGAAAFFLAAAA